MGEVIPFTFGKLRKPKRYLYQADVYTFNLEKYQYTITATSIGDAYNIVVWEALKSVQAIRCIALYLTETNRDYKKNRELIKVWQQLDPVAGELKEY